MSIATQPEIFAQDQPRQSRVTTGELREVTIEKLVYGGDGLAHIGTQAVFVPLAAVGDEEELPPAHGSRVGIRLSGRVEDGVLVRRRSGKAQRGRPVQTEQRR